MARTLKLTVQYDGTEYVGWQRQPEGRSIQGLLEDALKPIEGAAVTVHGAGRTDAGVHALAQIASVRVSTTLETATLARALNAALPPDVRVTGVEDAAEDFHARFSATGKVYQYRIVNGPVVSPFERRFAWHVIPRINLQAVRTASSALIGTHDFSAFQGTGSDVTTSERTIRRLEWSVDGDLSGSELLTLQIEGDGFLRHMVRAIAGTLAEIGLGRWPPSEMAAILTSRTRARAGPTAPAHGLFLARVLY